MLTAFAAVDLAAAVLAAPHRGIWSAGVVIGSWVAIAVLFGLVALRIRRYSKGGFAWFIVAIAAFPGMTPIALFVKASKRPSVAYRWGRGKYLPNWKVAASIAP